MGQARVDADYTDLNRRPLYIQLRDVFVGLVTSGEWKPNMLLPNEVQLAGRFAVSVGTIRKVMEELSELGLITRIQGRGTFVSDALRHGGHSAFDPLRNLDGSRITWDSPQVTVEEGYATQQEAVKLGQVGRKTEVVRLSWLRLRDGRAVAHQCSIVPLKLLLDVTRLRHVAGLSELYSRAGVLAHTSEDSLSPGTPDKAISDKLALPSGAQALLLNRRFRDEKAGTVGICSTWLALWDEVYTANYRLRSMG